MRVEDLDEAAALRAQDQAERELASHTDRVEIAHAQAQLAQAAAQLAAIEQLRRAMKR